MKIKSIRLENFIGINKIAKHGVFEVDINSNEQYILLYGENGLGKTTILESLNPYTEMVSRDIKDSITYPARKTIVFDNNEKEIKIDIIWEENKTKGYIYINNVMTEETSKGNITEYVYQIEKLFGSFEKFKTSLFLKQGVQDIVQAKPKERMNIINSFLNDLSIYDKVKDNVTQKEKEAKTKQKVYIDQISEMGTWEEEYNKYEERKNFFVKIDIKEKEEKYIQKKQEKLIIDKKETKYNILTEEQENTMEILKTKEPMNIVENKKKILIEKIIKKQEQISMNEINSLNQKQQKIKKYIEVIKEIKIEDIEVVEEDQLKYKKSEIENQIEINNRNKVIEDQIKELEEDEKNILKTIKTDFNLDLLKKIEQEQKAINQIESLFDMSIESLTKEDFNQESIDKNKVKEQIEINNRNKVIEDQIKELEEDEKNILKIIKTDLNLDLLKKEQEKREKQEYLIKEIKKLKELIINKQTIEYLENQIQKKQVLEKKQSLSTKQECVTCGQELDVNQIEKDIISLKKEIDELNIEETKKILEEVKEIEFNISIKEKELKEINNNKELKELEDIETEIKLRIKIEENENILNKTKQKIQFSRIEGTNEELKKKLFIEDLKQAGINKYIKEQNEIKNIEGEITKKEKQKNNKEQIEKFKKSIKTSILDLNNNKLNNLLKLIILNENEIEYKISLGKYEYLKKEPLVELEELNKKLENLHDIEKEVNQLIVQKNNLEKEILEISTIEKKYEKNNKDLNELNFDKEEKENINKEFSELEKEQENLNKENQFLINQQEHFERELKRYNVLLEEKIKIEEDIYSFNKLKNYSNRIKTAQVTNFFSNITDTVNLLIQNESGSLKDLKVKIEQATATKFNIIASNGKNEVNDISLLSGAEQSIVARGISLALAQKYNFGIIWLDETDSALSTTNKDSFLKTLDRAKQIIKIEQIFLVSHNDNLKKEVDNVINLNKLKKENF
jgi:DNA repair exonuclease SbcCD ATPase subunit